MRARGTHTRTTPRGRATRAAAAVLAWLMPAFALAQTPFVQDEWKFGRRQDGATLHYCVDERDPDLPVARKIGAAIAGALLLEPKEHAVGEDWSGEDIEQIYQVLLGTCDVFLGFKLIPDAYPDWLTITRGYYRASYVFVTADANWKSLADVPLAQTIGGTVGTSADIRLMQYLTALKPAAPLADGADAKKAKAYFEQARTRTKGQFLMAYVLEARYYAVGAQDKDLFKSLLQKAKDAPSGELPDAKLTDEAARLKAAALLEKADDYF